MNQGYLTVAQGKYIQDFINRLIEEMSEADNTLVVCYFCEEEKDFKTEPGAFSAFGDFLDQEHPEKGLILDSIQGTWACSKCLDRLKI